MKLTALFLKIVFVLTMSVATSYAAYLNPVKEYDGLTPSERQAKIDSIIVEVEKCFGWNDAAYSPENAFAKWQDETASLLLQGGIAPVVYPNDAEFKEKYGVGYDDFGCIANCSEKTMEAYNRVIMDCLTIKYGDVWLNDVRKDVPGLEDYGKDIFKSVSCNADGTSTVTVPAIYISVGKVVNPCDEGEKDIGRIANETSNTAMEFLFNGVNYYLPISKEFNFDNFNMDTTQPVELKIMFINHATLGCMYEIKPYPFDIMQNAAIAVACQGKGSDGGAMPGENKYDINLGHNAYVKGNSIELSAVEVLGYHDFHGCKIADAYNFIDSCYMETGGDGNIDKYWFAILSPDEYDANEGMRLLGNRLLVSLVNGEAGIYENVISNAITYEYMPCERFSIPTDEHAIFNTDYDFALEYTGGQGYKIGWDIGIKADKGKLYIVGLRFREHNPGLTYNKTISFGYEVGSFPLEEYRRAMIEMVREDKNPWHD